MKSSSKHASTQLTLAQRLLEGPSESESTSLEEAKPKKPKAKKRSKKSKANTIESSYQSGSDLTAITIEACLPELEGQTRKRNEVLGVLYIGLAMVIIAGLALEQKGQVQVLVSQFATLNGVGPVFLALFIFYCGVRRLMGQVVFEKSSQILAFPLMYFSFIGFLSATLPPLQGDIYLGGKVGQMIAWLGHSIIGELSTGITLLAAFLISFMHVTEIYISDLAVSGFQMMKRFSLQSYKAIKIVMLVLHKSVWLTLEKLHTGVYVVIEDLIVHVERWFQKEAEPARDDSNSIEDEKEPVDNTASKSVEEETLQEDSSIQEEAVESDDMIETDSLEKNESFDFEDDYVSDSDEEEDEDYPDTITVEVDREDEEEKEGLLSKVPGLSFFQRKEVLVEEGELEDLEEDVIPPEALEPLRESQEIPHETEIVEEAVDLVEDEAILEDAELEDEDLDEDELDGDDRYFDGAELPTISLLQDPPTDQKRDCEQSLQRRGQELVSSLGNFKVEVGLDNFVQGPTITRFELKTAKGTRLNKLRNLSDEIAMSLQAKSVRIEAPIPGTNKVGIEVPNANPVPVYFKEVIESITSDQDAHCLSIAFGKGIDGHPVIGNLAKMPHLLVAGATGAGKSVCVNTLISSILFRNTPEEVKFVMIDPKQVEFAVYQGIPHLITDVVTDPEQAAAALRWGVEEMEQRYTLLSGYGVRHIDNFNKKIMTHKLHAIKDDAPALPSKPLPYVVIIVDELADLMMVAKKDVETSICRIAQKARAVGIHLVIATQRPSVDVITGLIKANLPSRISFMVTNGIDSKTILDQTGAEKLLGKGDMLYLPAGTNKPERVQGAFMTDDEVEVLVRQIKDNFGEGQYEDIISDFMETEEAVEDSQEFYDEKFNAALDVIAKEKYASTSMLQRHLGIGYNRAARIVDVMYARGICGGQESGKKRKITIPVEEIPDHYI